VKKLLVMFTACAFAAIGLVVWVLGNSTHRGPWELAFSLVLLLLICSIAIMGVRKLRARRADEPTEDELSKVMMMEASSHAYYVSIYLWFALMLANSRLHLGSESLIGVGISGMALAFLASWIWAKTVARHDD